MPFTDVAPPVVTSSKTGISFSISESKKTHTARLTFNAKAQAEIFNGPIAGKTFRAKVGRGNDVGRLILIEDPEGDLVASNGVRGSSSIKMKAWDLLPKGPRPAGAVELIEPLSEGFLLRLPSWTKPTGVGGSMEEQHGLKPIGKRS